MSAAAIIAIIDVAFFVLLGIGFLQGFLRGVKRSTLELVLTVVGIVVVALITPVVTEAILKMNFPYNGTETSLNGIIIDTLSQEPKIANLLTSSPSTAELINKVPVLLVAALVFLSLNLAARTIVYGVYKLISLVFKSKKKEKELGLKRNRWAGGLISTLKMFVLALIIAMPVTSLVKLAAQIIPEDTTEVSAAVETESGETGSGETGSEEGGMFDSLPPLAKNLVHGMDKSVFCAINGLGNMDDLMLDGVAKIEINGEKINLRSEINNYMTLYTNVSTIMNADDLSKVDWDAMDKAYEEVTTNPLYNDVVLNIVGELIADYPTVVDLVPSLAEYQTIMQGVSVAIKVDGVNYAQYFKPDIDKVYYTISGAGRSGFLAEVVGKENLLDSITILVKKYDPVLTAAVNNLFDLNVVRDAFSPALGVAFDKLSTDPELGEIFDDAKTEITDWDSLKTQVKSAIVEVGQINGLLKEQNVAIGDITSDFMTILKLNQNTSAILSRFGSMIDAIDGLEFMQDSAGDKLMPRVLNKFGIGDLKDIKTDAGEKDATITTYKAAFEFISPSIEKLVSLDLYNDLAGETANFNSILKKFATKLVSEKTETAYSTFMSDVLLPLYKATALKGYIFTPLIEGSASTGVVDFSLLEVDGDWAASYANWASDLPHITIVITELEGKEYTTEQSMLDYLLSEGADMNNVVKNLDDATIDKIMPSILTAKSMQPLRDQLAGIVVSSIRDITGSTTATMTLAPASFTGEESQTSEFNAILKTFIEIYNSAETLSGIGDIDATLLGQLLNQMKANAYRVELSVGTENVKTSVGVTKSLFDAMIAKLQSEYGITLTSLFNVSHVYEIDFEDLINFITKVNGTNEFAQNFKNVAITGNQNTTEVDALMGSVKDNQASAKEILTLATDLDLNAGLSDLEKNYFSGKINELAEDTTIDSEIITLFRQLIGVTA